MKHALHRLNVISAFLAFVKILSKLIRLCVEQIIPIWLILPKSRCTCFSSMVFDENKNMCVKKDQLCRSDIDCPPKKMCAQGVTQNEVVYDRICIEKQVKHYSSCHTDQQCESKTTFSYCSKRNPRICECKPGYSYRNNSCVESLRSLDVNPAIGAIAGLLLYIVLMVCIGWHHIHLYLNWNSCCWWPIWDQYKGYEPLQPSLYQVREGLEWFETYFRVFHVSMNSVGLSWSLRFHYSNLLTSY